MHLGLSDLKPQKNQRIIDLVETAGLDISDWSNFEGGVSRAASNPKYCYEWSFIQREVVILNLWYNNLQQVKGGKIIQSLNMKQRVAKEGKSIWKNRASKVDHAMRVAYNLGLPIRAIICDGKQRTANNSTAAASKVDKRMLDPVLWAVASYDPETGDCTLERGLISVPPKEPLELSDDNAEGFEGELKRRFIFYRNRERRLRNLKIQDALYKNNGRLICEVPGCGFDFAKVYGLIGEHYAEVHHKFPLSEVPEKGKKTTLDDLVIVCSNCHSMIHRHGSCRPIELLIVGASSS